MAQQKMQPAPPLQIGHESFAFARSSNMPIALANRRMIQSAKGERGGGDRQFSAHHARQMVKLTSTAAASSQSQPPSQHKEKLLAVHHPPGPKPTVSSRSTAVSASDAKKQLENAFKIRSSAAMAQSPVARPMSSGAFKLRKIEPTMDLLEKSESRTLACLALSVLPMKQNLMTRNPSVLCVQIKVLQKMVLCCPYVGEALVPYYRQLLSIFNLFITKRVNCGDKIDYGQRRQENLGDLILETLNLLETHGGRDAFVNIKYMIPTYESCTQQQHR